MAIKRWNTVSNDQDLWYDIFNNDYDHEKQDFIGNTYDQNSMHKFTMVTLNYSYLKPSINWKTHYIVLKHIFILRSELQAGKFQQLDDVLDPISNILYNYLKTELNLNKLKFLFDSLHEVIGPHFYFTKLFSKLIKLFLKNHGNDIIPHINTLIDHIHTTDLIYLSNKNKEDWDYGNQSYSVCDRKIEMETDVIPYMPLEYIDEHIPSLLSYILTNCPERRYFPYMSLNRNKIMSIDKKIRLFKALNLSELNLLESREIIEDLEVLEYYFSVKPEYSTMELRQTAINEYVMQMITEIRDLCFNWPIMFEYMNKYNLLWDYDLWYEKLFKEIPEYDYTAMFQEVSINSGEISMNDPNYTKKVNSKIVSVFLIILITKAENLD